MIFFPVYGNFTHTHNCDELVMILHLSSLSISCMPKNLILLFPINITMYVGIQLVGGPKEYSKIRNPHLFPGNKSWGDIEHLQKGKNMD